MLDTTSSVNRLAPVGLGGGSSGSRRTGGAKDGTGAPADGSGPLTAGLQLAAQLIDLDLGTRVVAVGGNGFDTHAGEGPTHQELLTDLAQGLTGFFATLDRSGRSDRVLVLTISEFGRRVQENGSGGTDHGAGNVHLLAGAGLRRTIAGSADLAHLTGGGDVQPAIDARSLFAVGLDWLGGPSDEVLGRRYDTYGVLAA